MIDAVRIPLTGERSTKDGHPCPGWCSATSKSPQEARKAPVLVPWPRPRRRICDRGARCCNLHSDISPSWIEALWWASETLHGNASLLWTTCSILLDEHRPRAGKPREYAEQRLQNGQLTSKQTFGDSENTEVNKEVTYRIDRPFEGILRGWCLSEDDSGALLPSDHERQYQLVRSLAGTQRSLSSFSTA